MQTISVSMKKTGAGVELPTSLIVSLLPNIFGYLKCLHSLWVPAIHKQYVSPEFEEAFSLDDSTVSILMGKNAKARTEPQSKMRGIRSFIEYSREYWLVIFK